MKRRVVVTGMAGLSPIGNDWASVRRALLASESGIEAQSDWEGIRGLQTRLGGAVKNFSMPAEYPRQKTRGMGRVAQLSTRATELALRDARLFDHPALHDGSTGISYGSGAGSPPAFGVYARHVMQERTVKGISPNDFIQLMSHTVAANLGQFFEIRGRVIPTCSACTSGSQGVGYGFETIQNG